MDIHPRLMTKLRREAPATQKRSETSRRHKSGAKRRRARHNRAAIALATFSLCIMAFHARPIGPQRGATINLVPCLPRKIEVLKLNTGARIGGN